MDQVEKILDLIEKCSLRKLSRNLEDCKKHAEFSIWEQELAKHFPVLMELLNDYKLKNCSAIMSSLLILNYQLSASIPHVDCSSNCCINYHKKLNAQFCMLYNVTLKNLLKNPGIFQVQDIFNRCMGSLHSKLTSSDFKKYPALIEAYQSILKDVKDCMVEVNATSSMPVSLFLIEDYIDSYKIKGLQCCTNILECLPANYFNQGNYYEVIYNVLKKRMNENELEFTNLLLKCLVALFNRIPSAPRVNVIDDCLQVMLEQMYVESNLYKKKSLFSFLNMVVPMHGIHCVKRRMFLVVIQENLDICSNEVAAKIYLMEVLKCLESWIKYCWCVWNLSKNGKILSLLMKLFYIHRENDKILLEIQKNIITLVKLCSVEEQKQIYVSFESNYSTLKTFERFSEKLEVLKKQLQI